MMALRWADPGNSSKWTAILPIGIYGSEWSFGGNVKIDASSRIVDSTSVLEWNKEGAQSSFDAQGFGISLSPAGSYYNSLVNLQTYYLERDFTVVAEPVAGLPEEMLPSGQEYTADTMPHGVNVQLMRSGMALSASKLVKKGSSALYDLAASVNPWDVKISFVPETGLLNGTFRAWSDGVVQSQFATCKHYGILMMDRDVRSPLDEDIWTAGFYLLPVTEDWTHSLPFNIRSVTVDRDWSEVAVPEAE